MSPQAKHNRAVGFTLVELLICLVIVGMKGDPDQKNKAFAQALKGLPCIDLSGQTTIPDLLTLFNMGAALIANDSGLAHLASLTDIRQFILFGPESPQVFRPISENTEVFYSKWPCSPCMSAYNHRKSTCKDNKCLQAINPQVVYEQIAKRLALPYGSYRMEK